MKTEGSTDGTKPYAIKRLPTGGVEIQMSDMRSMKDVMSLAKELIAPTLQTVLDAKLTEHLGYEKYDPKGRNSGNSRNGYSPKTLKTSFGPASLLVPRDRSGTFEPIAVRKYETIDNDVEERIISMYAKGMTTRDIERHMQDLYGVEVSAGMISAITDKVMPLVQEWQSRPLSAQYVLVYLDGIHFKIRDTGKIVNKYSYTILGVNTEGKREILGLWRDCSKITGLLSSGPRLLSGSARLVTPCAWRFAPHGPRPPCGHLLVCPHPREALWPLARATMAPFHRLRRRGPPRVSANDHCLLQGGRPERGEARTARRAAVPPPPPRRPFGQCRLPPAASIAPRVPRLPARASLPSLGQPAGAAPPPPAGPVPPALGAHEGPRRPPGGPPLCPACGLAGGVRGGRGAWTALRPWRGRGGPGLARPGDGAPPRVDARLAPLARGCRRRAKGERTTAPRCAGGPGAVPSSERRGQAGGAVGVERARPGVHRAASEGGWRGVDGACAGARAGPQDGGCLPRERVDTRQVRTCEAPPHQQGWSPQRSRTALPPPDQTRLRYYSLLVDRGTRECKVLARRAH